MFSWYGRGSRVSVSGLHAHLKPPAITGPESALCPKFVATSILGIYVALGVIYVERQVRLSKRGSHPELEGGDHVVPNYYHVNNHRDIFYDDLGRGDLNTFGLDFINVSRLKNNGMVQSVWGALCRMDSDGDGATNGEELGDPCCFWETELPNSKFSLENRREYRRWFMTQPGQNWTREHKTPQNQQGPRPPSCNEYSTSQYEQQFDRFYFNSVRTSVIGHGVQIKHVFGACTLIGLCLYWMVKKGLLVDLMPWCFAQPNLSLRVCMSLNLAAFVYMDCTSGIAHLCLDYMPGWTPIIGVVATGFQEHHRNPALLARKPYWNQLNDVFILAPLAVVFLVGTNPSRVQRLFWFWSILYAILFLLAHPWAHMHPDQLPFLVSLAQKSGVLLNQDSHMRHHQDLESQFTILSGHADVFIDTLSQWLPPQRYDLWLFIFVTWFLTPIYMDIFLRSSMEKIELLPGRDGVWRKSEEAGV